MKRSTFAKIFCLAALFAGSSALARQGVLKTNDGITYRGDITEQEDRYIVTVDKIETPIQKSQVASVDYTGTIDEQFDDRIRKLDSKDAAGRVAVARFAFDHGRNDLAIQALSDALKIDPNNPDALEMLKTVNAQQQLNRQKAASATPAPAPAGTPGAAPGAGPGPASQPARRLLTAADINAIRQGELRSNEAATFSLAPDMRRKFLSDTGMSPAAFSSLSSGDQLTLLLSKGSDEVKAATKITRDPIALADFKRSIHPAVLRNCATSGCHAGESAGSFVLFNGTDDATVYTNFYIMEQYSQVTKGDGSFFGSAQRKLIDRGNGVRSLLVNFGLPPQDAEVPHPTLANGNSAAIFRGRSGAMYDAFVDWMNNRLKLIEPNYGIKYDIPHGHPPASQPAAK